MLRTVPTPEQHDRSLLTLLADDLPAAPVVGIVWEFGSRFAQVRCPFCGATHRHVFPPNLPHPVGVRLAPCQRGALYRPESSP